MFNIRLALPVKHAIKTATTNIRFYVTAVNVPEAFENAGIVPDVIDKSPKNLVEIAFGKHAVNLGNTLTPTIVKDPPTKLQWNADVKKLYTLLKTDPDAPSRAAPTFREWHHWLIVNIKGEDLSTGDTLSEYIGAGPPEGTGKHRYIYLVFEQPGKITDKEHGHLTNHSANNRGGFSTRKFMQKHNLGVPIAGNFYLAEYDDYVPKLYKQLGG